MTGEQTLDEAVIEGLVIRAGGDAGFAARVIEAFTAQGESLLAELRAARAEGDPETVGAIAHKLGGSGANLGAGQLHTRCLELESRARDGRVDGALVDGVLESYRATCDALHARWVG